MNNDTITISPDKRSMMANIINLMTVAYLDGTVSDEEKQVIGDIAQEYGLTQEEFEFCADKAEADMKEGKAVVEVPEDDNAKVVFLRNLVMTMMCDGRIDENEENFVKFITEKFGFKPDEMVEYLINSIADEFSGKTGDITTEGNEEEARKKEIANAIALGKEALDSHDIRAAFDNLVNPAHLDRDALALFLRIPDNEHWIRLLSEEQVDLLKEYAEKGYAVSQFALGRYYQVVEASYDEARDLFIAASKAGLTDATAALAIMYRLGQFGEIEIDKDKYLQSLQDACSQGSALANHQLLKAEILGLDGVEARPQEIIDGIKKWLNGNESEDLQVINPIYYELMGLAYQVLDDWKTAAEYYMKCVRMGYVEVYPDYLILSSYNQNYELIDEEGYYKGIETGCQIGIPYCFLMRATLNKDRYDSTDDEKEKEALHKSIAQDLTTASNRGDGNAALQLAYHYYYGEYGFEEDNNLAWGQCLDATSMNMADAWSMLVQIVLDDNGPDNLPNNFVAYCRLMALRLGDQDQLIPVVIAYRSGGLGKYKNEVEKYYLPQYNALSDEEKVSYFGMNFIAVIKPSGKADLIEFDLETETWDELCEVIDADEMKPIRTGTLNQIAKDVDLDDHITAWVDSDGKAKGLEENPTGNKIYPGPVLGWLILTLEDEEGNQHCFDDIYQLEDVIEKLGCEVEDIYYDEFPDDDRHNDPHA